MTAMSTLIGRDRRMTERIFSPLDMKSTSAGPIRSSKSGIS